MTIAIIDYGAGNIGSVLRAVRRLGAEPKVCLTPQDLDGTSAIILPGVAHFSATAALDGAWRGAVRSRVDRGTPLLGICLGMQWLFDGSDEAPGLAGLGWFAGRCRRLPVGVRCPHVGWNTLARVGAASRLLRDLPEAPAAYFSHTFVAPLTDATTAQASHGAAFSAVVERGRVFGVQWHPEKSGAIGAAALRAFLEMARPSCP